GALAGRSRRGGRVVPAEAAVSVRLPSRADGVRGVRDADTGALLRRPGRRGVRRVRRARRGPGVGRIPGDARPPRLRQDRARRRRRPERRHSPRGPRHALRLHRVLLRAPPALPPAAGPGDGAVSYLSDLDLDRLPTHVGIVMDGNGRWAKQRGLPRTEGHAAGEEALFDTVEGALDIGLKWLTVFAFSTENWRRPPDEVRYLMNFNRGLLRRRRDELHERGA